MRSSPLLHASAVALLTLGVIETGATQQRTTPPSTGAGANAGDWPSYRHDLAGTGASPLTQITPRNVAALTRAWTYRLQSDAPPAAVPGGRGGAGGVNSEVTPIVVNRV